MNGRDAGNAWRKVKLIEVCQQITVGHVGSMKEEYLDQGIPFLRSQNVRPFRFDPSALCHISPAFHEKLKKSSLSPGDVVVTRTGANTGQCCVIPTTLPNANCADLVIFRPSLQLDPYFLMYLLNSSWGQATISGGVVGAAQHHFNIGVAKELVVSLPQITSQRKIASILSAYDDLIENNTRRIAILEKMAQAIYREWFVNFRFPGHENVKLVDSPLGKIPEGWEVTNLFDVAEVAYGFPYKSKQFSDQPIGKPVIRIRDVLGHKSNTYTLEDAGEKYVVNNGDILIGMDGDFHMCRWAGGEAVLNQRVARLRTKGQLPQYVLFHAVKEPIAHFNAIIVGTTVAHLGDKHLREINVLVPTKDILASVHEQFGPLFSEEINLRKKNQLLRTTRDLLLPKLISGKLDVEDLDIDTGLTAEALEEATA